MRFLAKYRVICCIPLVATTIAFLTIVVVGHIGSADPLNVAEICMLCIAMLAASLIGFILGWKE